MTRFELTRARRMKLLRWLGVALLVPYLGYLLLMNVALNTGLFARLINSAQDDMVMSIESGWSVWPLRLRARNLRLRFEDANVQFSLHVERVATRIDFPAALEKTFHAYWVRGEGVSYWFRHKLEDVEGNARRVAGFPVIAGYDPVPLLVPWPPSTSATEDLFIIQLDDVQAEVRDFWMLEFRFLGRGHASGSFRLAPRRHFWLHDTQITFEQGRLDLGKLDTIASTFTGQVRTEFKKRNPDNFTMMQNLTWADWRLDLTAAIRDAGFVGAYLGSDVHVNDGQGPLRIAVQTLNQRIVDGSRMRYASKALRVRSGSLRSRIAGSFDFEVASGSPRIALGVPRARIWPSRAPASVLVRRLRASASLAHADLDRALQLRSLDAHVGSVRTGKAGLDLPGGLHLDGEARGRLSGRAGTSGRLAGRLSAALVRSSVRHGTHSVAATAKAGARFITWRDWTAGGRLSDAHLKLTQVNTRSGEDANADWWLTVEAPTIDYQGFPPRAFNAELALSARDGAPLIAALEAEGELPPVVGFLWTADNLRGRATVRSTPRELDLNVTHVDSDSLGGKGRYLKRGEQERAVFLVTAGRIGVGFELGAAGMDAAPFSGNRWFEARTRAVFGPEPDAATERASRELFP